MERGFKIGNLLEYISILLNGIGVGLILLVALWIGADVFARGFFSAPIAGTPEIVKTSTVAVAFLCFFHTLRHGRMIRADIVVRRFPQGTQQIIAIFSNLLGLVAFVILARYSWDTAWASFLLREWEGMKLRIPVYPSRFIIFVGSSLLSLQYLLYLIQTIKTVFRSGGKG